MSTGDKSGEYRYSPALAGAWGSTPGHSHTGGVRRPGVADESVVMFTYSDSKPTGIFNCSALPLGVLGPVRTYPNAYTMCSGAMLPGRTLCPTYDPSECASRPNQVQAMARSETAERLACLVMRCSAAILALERSPCWLLEGHAARG